MYTVRYVLKPTYPRETTVITEHSNSYKLTDNKSIKTASVLNFNLNTPTFCELLQMISIKLNKINQRKSTKIFGAVLIQGSYEVIIYCLHMQ